MSSGLGNGNATVRSSQLARAMSCGLEVGGRAWRGLSGSYSWLARGPLSSQLLDSGRETREELCEEERNATRMSGSRCLPGSVRGPGRARSKSGVALGQKRGHVKPGTVSHAHPAGSSPASETSSRHLITVGSLLLRPFPVLIHVILAFLIFCKLLVISIYLYFYFSHFLFYMG
jgi:hypothetical protein